MALINSERNSLRADGLVRPHGLLIAFLQRFVDASFIVGSLGVANLAYNEPWSRNLSIAAALAVICFQLASAFAGVYRSWRTGRLGKEFGTIMGAWLLGIPVLLLGAFLTKTTDEYSRVVMTAWLLGAPVSMIVLRIPLRIVLRYYRARGRNERRVVIVGATESGIKLCKRISSMPDSGNRVLGVYDDRSPERITKKALGGQPLLGGLKNLVDDARNGRLDAVYIALPLRAEQRIQEVISGLADTTANVYVLTDLFMFDLMNARWGSVGDMPVVSVFDTPFQGLGGSVKRVEDIILSSIILVMIALPMLFIAIAIKMTSKGPVFFRQTRYGLKGRPIKVLKFRSMTTMDDGAKVVQATKNDARITPLGRILRRTSLDELPQFLNVFSGEMSVVGPRPHAVAHNELYRSKIRGYMLRHKVKPGITGWAQVNGWRGETDVVEKMEGRVDHDLYYIDNWSLFWDLKIVFLTVFGRKVHSGAG